MEKMKNYVSIDENNSIQIQDKTEQIVKKKISASNLAEKVEEKISEIE